MRNPSNTIVLPTVLALLTGCIGNILGSDGPGGGGGDKPPPVTDEPRNLCASGQSDRPGPRLLRRLTGPELTASVRDAFGLSATDYRGSSLPPDPAGRNGFNNNADRLAIDGEYADALLFSAKEVGKLVSSAAQLPRILPCASGGGASCAETFLDTFGRRLYRRPLSDEEKGRYLDLLGTVTGNGGDFKKWVFWTTVGLVQSPNFIWRAELGDGDGGEYTLSGYEVATALAFDLTGRPPSDALLDLADRGGLDSADGITAAARGLILDDAGQVRADFRDIFQRFVSGWLGLSSLANLQKSPELYPQFTQEIRDAMKREVTDFVSRVVFDQRGTVADLLTSPETVFDRTLAGYYGYGPADQAQAAPVTRPDGWGLGLLAQGSVLAIKANNERSSPTQRGKLVRERFLCSDMPAPPAGVAGNLPQVTGDENTRQRYELISQNATCAACHQNMDPIGFAFEHLDAVGRYRDQEQGGPIDSSGYLHGFGDDVPFNGAAEVATTLASRPETASCMAAFMSSFAFGLDHHDTSCLVSSLGKQLGEQMSIVDFYLALAQTAHFTRRVD